MSKKDPAKGIEAKRAVVKQIKAVQQEASENKQAMQALEADMATLQATFEASSAAHDLAAAQHAEESPILEEVQPISMFIFLFLDTYCRFGSRFKKSCFLSQALESSRAKLLEDERSLKREEASWLGSIDPVWNEGIFFFFLFFLFSSE